MHFVIAPSQQPPPKVENLDPNSLRLFWDAPDHPNGVILSYKLYREDKLIATLDPNGEWLYSMFSTVSMVK